MNSKLDRVPWIRHFAFCAGAAAAYGLHSELRIGVEALWVVGAGALLNICAFALSRQAIATGLAHRTSAAIGIASWGALIAVTNGVSSPFVAGLWLEVPLAAAVFRPAGIAGVTLGAMGALWAQQWWLGFTGAGTALAVEMGFLLVMGAVTVVATHRWHRTRNALGQQQARLADRLARMEHELEDGRVVGRLGENVGRLAHGLKNSVHSLRGFIGLIEPEFVSSGRDLALLDGLRGAVDDLEALARMTLDANSARDTDTRRECACDPASVLSRALREISLAHPDVRWKSRLDGASPVLPIAPADLREVVLVVLRNAVEAMGGRGAGSLETRTRGGEFGIVISDEGVGIPPEQIPLIFQPGYTTKADGSGYGLFLARKIIKERGGQLAVKPGDGKGAIFELKFPLGRPPGARE